MNRPRVSDHLCDPAWVQDPDFTPWCSVAISLWNTDPALRIEFVDIIDLLDWAYELSSRLILSAEN